MPINIYRLDDNRTNVAILCPNEWRLPEQVGELERWIMKKRKKENIAVIADIGFQSRKDAAGGGSSLSAHILKRLGEFNIDLHLSEYPGFATLSKST